MLAGFLIRLGQTVIEASTTLVGGLVIAALFRHVLGSEGLRRLFGDGGWSSCLRAWFIGMLLPVCSLGVIPVARELCRSRVPLTAVLSFTLATPQLNPFSLLYGLTLAKPSVLGIFILCQLGVAVLGGRMWQILQPRNNAQPGQTEARQRDALGEELPLPEPGVRRLFAIVVSAAHQSVGVSLGYAAIGISATALVASLLPFGALSQTMRHDQVWSAELMFGLGAVIYSGVLPGMMRITSMLDHGNSVGAAFVLFQIGIGWNAGLLVWLLRQLGWRRGGLWILAISAWILVLAHVMEPLIYFAYSEADHTHAFDDWTAPLTGGTWELFGAIWKAWGERVGVLELIGLACLGLLLTGGVLLRWWDGDDTLLRYLAQPRPKEADTPSIWNRPLPGWVTKSFFFGLPIGLGIAGLYLYFPNSQQGFLEIARIRADAYSAIHSENVLEAIRQLEYYDVWLRKTQIGTYLRSGNWDRQLAETTAELRQCIEHLRDLLLDHNLEQAKAYIATVEQAHRRCREAYRRSESLP